MKFRNVIAIVVALWVLNPGAPSWAQTATGNVYGKVVDQSGAVLPGASVTVSGEAGSRSSVTGADGTFRFLNLDPNDYTVTVNLSGFGSANRRITVQTGLSAWLGQETQAAAGLPLWLLVLVVALLCSLVTECASNVATATIFMPIAATLALAGQYDPVPVALAAGMAASWGFANPAGTSSNAMVYGTGRVRVPDMLRSGLWLDVACAILITLTCVLLVPWLGFKPG